MDIKFTHTGAIPFNEFPEDQEFMVIRADSSSPVFICNGDDAFRIANAHMHISHRESFLAWEPISFTLPSCALVTRRLWLLKPCLSDPQGWIFGLYEKPREYINTRIRDAQFNREFFNESQLSVSFGDVFEATMAKVSNRDGFIEVYKLRRIGNESEKLRELLDELQKIESEQFPDH